MSQYTLSCVESALPPSSIDGRNPVHIALFIGFLFPLVHGIKHPVKTAANDANSIAVMPLYIITFFFIVTYFLVTLKISTSW